LVFLTTTTQPSIIIITILLAPIELDHNTKIMMMKEQLVIGIVQPGLRSDDESPLEATKRICKMMIDRNEGVSSNKIDLFVLPELCPIGYLEDTFQKYLPINSQMKVMYQEVDEEMKQTARLCRSFTCYGTIGWDYVLEKERYYIRQNVIDPTGSLVASYNKIYLCDYGDCNETRFFTSGSIENASNGIFICHGWKIGIIICADIRYPLLCRQLVLEGAKHQNKNESSKSLSLSILDTCQVILQPACFSRDLSFRTWKSFRETRAVENSVYFVALNYAGSNYGESSITPPWVDENHEPIVCNTEPGIFESTLEKNAVKWAREEMPYYRFMIRDQ
jgi:predicted amidohydrolase